MFLYGQGVARGQEVRRPSLPLYGKDCDPVWSVLRAVLSVKLFALTGRCCGWCKKVDAQRVSGGSDVSYGH